MGTDEREASRHVVQQSDPRTPLVRAAAGRVLGAAPSGPVRGNWALTFVRRPRNRWGKQGAAHAAQAAHAAPPAIVVVGGGYAGFYAAWKLERRLRPREASVTLIDPLPYMTYQPFLPEVIAGSIEARHCVVSFRRHLSRTRLLSAEVSYINHSSRTVTMTGHSGAELELGYDVLIVTAGAVSRTVPIPGVAEEAIGLKHIEEAVTIRDRLVSNFQEAANLPPGHERARLLTVTFVGGGYAGVEGVGELRALATELLRFFPEIEAGDISFHLVEAGTRILPEVSVDTAQWVVRHLQGQGVHVHLETQLSSAVGGRLVLSDGQTFDSALLVWTAGVMPNPSITRHTDLPIDARGRIRVRADLRVGTDSVVIPDVWAGGDNAAVPDLTGGGIDGFTVPNAQHAVRQGKLLARNVTASLRGRQLVEYRHRNLGTVATLGPGSGVFQSGRVVVRGLPAWALHRLYHGLAIPSWERKLRVLCGWLLNGVLGRDIIGLHGLESPRATFERYAERSQSSR